MTNTFIGILGHFFVVTAFVTALLAAYAYIRSSSTADSLQQNSFRKYARWTFYVHGASVLGIVGVLYAIVYNNMFEYHYAWNHSSLSLPVYYIISSFWEGQEGSFLLWMFWHVVLGLVLIKTNKRWEAPVMSVFVLVQAFLASMILGVVIGEVKIGSSPFLLLRDVMEAPVFETNPDFVPEDGTGLNPLLQNYWMVIHPPTLFLGYATTLIPFAFCIAGLWRKEFTAWVKPALPWAIFSAAVLGLGIIMGAYWAYETLNFGGYWNWDPVENSVYVPWLILVAAVHTMIIFKKSNTALKTSIVLVIASFILVLYSTFLTRSGILGEASVHSFTDLGLSGQLLLYLLAFLGIAIVLAARSWKQIPTSEKEASAYSREFWIFIGATTLCLMGFQVLVPTSIPVYNAVIELFGGISNVAPPADQVAFYTKFQLWFGVAIALLSGTGQFFFWKKMDKDRLKSALTYPIIITLLFSSAIIASSQMTNVAYIALLTGAIYSVVSNSTILVRMLKSNVKLIGGSVAHIGVAMILLGVLFSAGYSNIVSINNTGMLLFNEDVEEEENATNVLLWYNEPVEMGNYKVAYKGERLDVRSMPEYVKKNMVKRTPTPYLGVAAADLTHDGKTYHRKGDTVRIHPENVYYEVEYTEQDGEKFSLYPRVQDNPNMGYVVSPDILQGATKDLYTHVTAFTEAEKRQWKETDPIKASPGKQFFINDYVAVLKKVDQVSESKKVELLPEDIAVQATVEIYGGEDEVYELKPLYIIRNRQVARVSDTNEPLGIRLEIDQISPQDNTFTFHADVAQKEFIVMKAIEKPLINLLWIGTIILMLGFSIAIYRRYTEFVKERDKEAGKSQKPGKGKRTGKAGKAVRPIVGA